MAQSSVGADLTLILRLQEASQRKRSHAVMSELRGRGELLSSDQEKAALARLLGNDSSVVRS